MDTDYRQCKRCWLYELADRTARDSVRSYLDTVPDSEKATEEVCDGRLALCRACEFLLTGMCRKCGCYVEIRAALSNSGCPAGKW